jgi:MoxR-like ATPase
MINVNISPSIEQITQESNRFTGVKIEVSKVIVGQEDIINFITIAILCNGHILLEGVPGIAKTTMIKTIARALNLQFNRIQFTPDLLPSDIIGTMVYNPKEGSFETKKGPIFANLILADEINRAPAKVQSALLEAMEEQQITIDSQTYPLDQPFLVFATQNPIEQEGTYQLPEAQLDRFMFKINVGYPSLKDEREILRRSTASPIVQPAISKEEIFEAQEIIKNMYVDDKIAEYITSIVHATRALETIGLQSLSHYIQYGVSPRATIALYKASKAYAFLKKRNFVIPDDVKAVTVPILRHRIVLTYQAEADGVTTDDVITKIVQHISAP